MTVHYELRVMGKQKYVHEIIGVNSRLDPIQAAILVKFKYFSNTTQRKEGLAELCKELQDVEQLKLQTPVTFNARMASVYGKNSI